MIASDSTVVCTTGSIAHVPTDLVNVISDMLEIKEPSIGFGLVGITNDEYNKDYFRKVLGILRAMNDTYYEVIIRKRKKYG